jgi:hypothetical protein
MPQIMDSKSIPAANDLVSLLMAQEQQINASKLLGMPLEIRKMIWEHLDEGPEISVLDLRRANENGLMWTTEKVTREEYEDRFCARTQVAINNTATSNVTTNWQTLHPRFAIIAQIVSYVLNVAWILSKDIVNVMDGFIWFLATISTIAALETLKTNLR